MALGVRFPGRGDSARRHDVAAQPLVQHGLGEGAGFEVAVDEGDHRLRLSLKPRAVEAEEDVQAGEGHALVAVDEGMVHREAFPQRRSFLNQIGIIAALRSRQRGLQQALIADAGRAAEQTQLLGVDEEHVNGRKVDHRLFGERFINLRPALCAFSMQLLDGRVALGVCSFGEALELLR